MCMLFTFYHTTTFYPLSLLLLCSNSNYQWLPWPSGWLSIISYVSWNFFYSFIYIFPASKSMGNTSVLVWNMDLNLYYHGNTVSDDQYTEINSGIIIILVITCSENSIVRKSLQYVIFECQNPQIEDTIILQDFLNKTIDALLCYFWGQRVCANM